MIGPLEDFVHQKQLGPECQTLLGPDGGGVVLHSKEAVDGLLSAAKANLNGSSTSLWTM